MRILFTVFAIQLLIVAIGFSQVINSAGDWDDSGIWNGANIADDISEDPSFNNDLGTITVRATFNYTVGTISMNNGNALTVASSGSLTVGANGNPKDLITGNSATLNIDGDLTVWGDLSIGNDLIINVTGTLTIKGNLEMFNGGDLTVAGDVVVEGNFVGGNNTALDIDGSIAVSGDFDVGNGSTATGSGSVVVGGTCTDNPVGICSTGPLPISLLAFVANIEGQSVKLNWATASEENFAFFSIERSSDGLNFESIGTIDGYGNSLERIDYSHIDQNPLLGVSYYRLMATDLDGSFEIFEIAGVNFYGDIQSWVYPNPTSATSVRIGLNEFVEGTRATLHNLVGELILDVPIRSLTSEFVFLDHLGNGIYLVTVQNRVLTQRHRLVLRR